MSESEHSEKARPWNLKPNISKAAPGSDGYYHRASAAREQSTTMLVA